MSTFWLWLDKLHLLLIVVCILFAILRPVACAIFSGIIAGITVIATYQTLSSWIFGGAMIVFFGGMLLVHLCERIRFLRH